MLLSVVLSDCRSGRQQEEESRDSCIPPARYAPDGKDFHLEEARLRGGEAAEFSRRESQVSLKVRLRSELPRKLVRATAVCLRFSAGAKMDDPCKHTRSTRGCVSSSSSSSSSLSCEKFSVSLTVLSFEKSFCIFQPEK
ncbi:hypothetical protein FQA47_018756 [Oryzias melastigma]|uniref:Uncharacterized protein n=1 Tax=Oryzias melastigma TaxID=30732 RepID=A0A834C9N9_ORYME|nr:hypothetical protein FQA47_018756 [Oryzias melastigma]